LSFKKKGGSVRARFFNNHTRSLVVLGFSFLLMACGQKAGYAPVVVARSVPASSSIYQTVPGDTIYSIAWAYGSDVEALLQVNHLKAATTLSPGQRLVIPKTHERVVLHGSVPILSRTSMPSAVVRTDHRPRVPEKAMIRPHHKKNTVLHRPQRVSVHGLPKLGLRHWYWPKHRVSFESLPRHGVWVQVHQVRALAPGVVVYTGRGLKGYGHLIIVRHAGQLLSAYGHVRGVRVKLGQRLKRAQKMAMSGHHSQGVYLEVRRRGRPIDLHRYLK
jgi:lipoprotein NlpD